MTLFVSNDEILDHFSVKDYLPVAEQMYRSLGEKMASSTPIETTLTHVEDSPNSVLEPVVHAMRTCGGAIKPYQVAAIRLNSDIKYWPERNGTRVQERHPVKDGRYNGLVFLFSTETGELLMMFPDGIIQTYHVAGGIATAAKDLSIDESRTLGMYGTGHQASVHLPALDHVLDLEEIKVYSRTPKNRQTFAEEMDERTAATVRAVDDPRAVCEGSDVVSCATNSTEPVFDASWIEPGTHLGYIRPAEVPQALFESSDVDRLIISKPDQRSVSITGAFGHLVESDEASDPWHYYVMDDGELPPKHQKLKGKSDLSEEIAVHRLSKILAGKQPGRRSSNEITVFRQVGDGVAFTAIGHALYEKAKSHDLGEEVMEGKITQEYVP